MKKLLLLFGFLSALNAYSADIKISQLPLGSASTSSGADSFPFVSASTNVTKRLTLWDIVNIPTLASTYAPKANPTFTGTVTAPTFVGALTGNASTASALAANPTDCSSGLYAYAIAANGNLTCQAVAASELSGTLAVSKGGTGLSSGTSGGLLAFTGSGTLASTAAGSTNQILLSAGTSSPIWSTATYPATTTANQLLYSSGTNAVGGLSSMATGALVTSSGSVPSFASGTTANRVLRTDGTSVTFSQVAAGTDISGQLGISNGGTGQATKAAAFDALSPMSAIGDLIYGGASGTGTRLAGGSTGQLLFANSSAAPSWTTATFPSTTTANQLLYSSATNTVGGLSSTATGALVTSSGSVPSFASGATANRVLRTDGTSVTFSQVAAGTDISGQLAIANGGTGQATKAAGFDALSPMSASGDIIYGGASGTGTRLVKGSDGTVLTLASGVPTWAANTPSSIRSSLIAFTGNQYGSSNVAVRRWVTANITVTGSDLSYTDSATAGTKFNILTTALYCVNYSDSGNGGGLRMAIVQNGSAGSTSIQSITVPTNGTILGFQGTGTSLFGGTANWCGLLNSGDFLWSQTDQGAVSDSASRNLFSIVKIGG